MDSFYTRERSLIGLQVYGFCGGYFGRNISWGQKVIEGEGRDWIVVRDDQGHTWFAQFSGPEQKYEEVEAWKVPALSR